MAHHRIIVTMPGSASMAFEAFHNHKIRLQWDTLLSEAGVEGGGDHPYVGAITYNRGKGWMAGLRMRTKFVSYEPPRLAAAHLLEPTGLFEEWAASMKHRDLPDGSSELVYSFNLRMRPRWLFRLMDGIAQRVFAYQTRKRFKAMAVYLQTQGAASTTSGA